VPMNTLTPAAAERWGIDVERGERHRQQLLAQAPALAQKIRQIHGEREFTPVSDPDRNLYGGGFFSDADRRQMTQIQNMEPRALARLDPAFDDPRLPEMLFRYRARNWPETLSAEERVRWEAFRRDRLTNPAADAGITLDQFRQTLARMMVDPEQDQRAREILSELADWPAIIDIA